MKKKVKALILSLIATLALGSFAACGSKGDDTSSNSEIVSGSQDPTSETVDSNDGGTENEISISLVATESIVRFASKQLTATVKGTQEAVTWSSSAPAVATVDENGLVSALTLGEAVITASVGGVSASCTVTVTETDIPHEIEISLEEVSVFEGAESEELEVSVSYDGADVEGDFEYTWSLVEGDGDVVSIATGENGKTAVFTGLKTGTVTYEIYTVARGYEAAKEITITVKENTYSLGIAHKNIVPVDNGYAVGLTLGDEATDNVTFGDAYLAINGVESDENVSVNWSLENDSVTFANGKITAVKAGTGVLTGTATYKDKTLTVILTVTVEKGQVTLDDTDMIEVVTATTFDVPASVDKGTVEKVYIGENVLFDAANAKGSIDGNVVTVDKAGLPAKEEYLGEGKTLTIETNLVVYTMTVDVYTMIIDSVEELDMWQEIAADNAIRAGLCIEAQKGLVSSGYFVLGGNIEYNKVWKPYKAYGDLWALCYQNQDIWKDVSVYKAGTAPAVDNRVDGAIVEDWGHGINAGFKGVFDGQGYYINGLDTSSDKAYNAFIITLGGGVVRNVAFTNMTIGAGCGSVVDRGQGTIEDVYVEVNKIESGRMQDGGMAQSWGLIRSGNGTKHGVNRAIIDYSDADLSNVENVYLGCDITSEVLQGVYVLGVPASYTGAIWNHADIVNHKLGSYERYVDLFADEDAMAVIRDWTGMWKIGEGYVVPNSTFDGYTGDFEIACEDTTVPANSSMILVTNRSKQFMTYTTSNEVAGVTLEGNVITVSADAKGGEKFTIVATSAIDGKTAEMTFTVGLPIVVLDDTLADIEVITTETITLPASVKGTVSKIMIGSCTVYDSAAGIGDVNGSVVTVESLPVKNSDLGKGVNMTVSTSEAVYELKVNVYTMVIDTKEELDNWQAVAADNSVKAGVVIEEQKLAYLTGYFVLGADIAYNGVWTPIIPYAGQANSLYNLCNKTNNNVLGWIEQYGADKVIAVNGWTQSDKLGFHGTFDGNGHCIDGMETSGQYSGFTVIAGHDSVFKNVAFTNAKVGAKSGFLYNRGGGTIENVYIEVVSMENGAGSDMTSLFGNRGQASSVISNLIVNASKCDFLTAEGMYLVDVGAAEAYGAYVIGAEEFEATTSTAGATGAFWNMAKNDVAGSFESVEALLADETHGAIVAAMGGYWKVEDGKLFYGDIQLVTAPKKVVIETEYKTDEEQKVVLENEAFTVGSVWTMLLNDVESEVTIEEEGKLELVIDPATVNGYLVKVTLTSEKQILYYSNVIAVTYIYTAEELKALGVGGGSAKGENDYSGAGNSYTAGNDKTGYYMLADDIDCAEAGVFAAGYSGQKSYFKGVFDGNGKTISNITVNEGGIFGGLNGATVKNINFTGVKYDANLGNYAGNWGNYTALLAQLANEKTVIENINVQVAEASFVVNNDGMREGLLFQYCWGGVQVKNVTVDASYLDLECILGDNITDTSVTFENYVIKAASYGQIAYGDSNAGKPLVIEWPEGVTFQTVAHLGITNTETTVAVGNSLTIETIASSEVTVTLKEAVDGVSISGNVVSVAETATVGATFTVVVSTADESAERTFTITKNYVAPEHYVTDTSYVNKGQYTGDETTLGFAQGTYVFETVATTDAWTPRIIIPANSAYDYVEFDIYLTAAVQHLTAWPAKDKTTKGSMILNGGGMTTSDGVVRTVQVFTANGNTMAQQHTSGFAANTLYTVRVYFNEGEDLNELHLGTSTAQTYYIANVTWGNLSVRNDVYGCASGELLAKYSGDVTALGFDAGSSVTEVAITSAWGSRVRVDGDIKYDYVDVEFSLVNGEKTIYSLCVWAYGTSSGILTGNYSVTATKGTAANGATERTVQILDANGNAVTALTTNTVYTLRVYLNGDASSIAVSTFDTVETAPAKIYFGDITYGNDAQ